MRKYIILLFVLILFVIFYELYVTYFTNFEFNVSNIKEYLSNLTIISSEYIYPTKYTDVSSSFGYRFLFNSANYHDGIDFLAPQGSQVYASNSGYISYASFLSGYGNTIIITHEDNTKTLYGHLAEDYIVETGDYVVQGQLIGYVGPKILSNGMTNGNTTGPHLHFTVIQNDKKINPNKILKKVP